MLGLVLRRLLISIPILFLSSILVFIMVSNAGDPLGDLKSRNPPVPAAVIKARQHQYGLDKPATSQYVHWVTHFVKGDFGRSLTAPEPSALLMWDGRSAGADHVAAGQTQEPRRLVFVMPREVRNGLLVLSGDFEAMYRLVDIPVPPP